MSQEAGAREALVDVVLEADCDYAQGHLLAKLAQQLQLDKDGFARLFDGGRWLVRKGITDTQGRQTLARLRAAMLPVSLELSRAREQVWVLPRRLVQPPGWLGQQKQDVGDRGAVLGLRWQRLQLGRLPACLLSFGLGAAFAAGAAAVFSTSAWWAHAGTALLGLSTALIARQLLNRRPALTLTLSGRQLRLRPLSSWRDFRRERYELQAEDGRVLAQLWRCRQSGRVAAERSNGEPLLVGQPAVPRNAGDQALEWLDARRRVAASLCLTEQSLQVRIPERLAPARRVLVVAASIIAVRGAR